jgi:hypothetical protein
VRRFRASHPFFPDIPSRLITSHPLPPLLLLPPLSLSVSLTTSVLAFLLITLCGRSRKQPTKVIRPASDKNPMSEEALLAEKQARAFDARDQDEKDEAARRREEWEQVESSALGERGLRRTPAEAKRSEVGDSTIGGVSAVVRRLHQTDRDSRRLLRLPRSRLRPSQSRTLEQRVASRG